MPLWEGRAGRLAGSLVTASVRAIIRRVVPWIGGPDEPAWNHVAVGTGHPDGVAFWTRFVDALRAAGYDGPLSIEEETTHSTSASRWRWPSTPSRARSTTAGATR